MVAICWLDCRTNACSNPWGQIIALASGTWRCKLRQYSNGHQWSLVPKYSTSLSCHQSTCTSCFEWKVIRHMYTNHLSLWRRISSAFNSPTTLSSSWAINRERSNACGCRSFMVVLTFTWTTAGAPRADEFSIANWLPLEPAQREKFSESDTNFRRCTHCCVTHGPLNDHC